MAFSVPAGPGGRIPRLHPARRHRPAVCGRRATSFLRLSGHISGFAGLGMVPLAALAQVQQFAAAAECYAEVDLSRVELG